MVEYFQGLGVNSATNQTSTASISFVYQNDSKNVEEFTNTIFFNILFSFKEKMFDCVFMLLVVHTKHSIIDTTCVVLHID